jgi:hypothetical protein
MFSTSTVGLLLVWIASTTSALGYVPPNCIGVNTANPEFCSNEALHRRDSFYVGSRYVYNNVSRGNILVD